MKQFLIKFFIYSALIFILLNSIAYLSLYFLGKSSFYKPNFVSNGVNDKIFDYLILGSSTGLTTLDTKLIDSITFKKGLNISMDDSSLSSHFLMLKHFFLLGKTSKKLVLVVTPWDLSCKDPKLNNNDYRFLPLIKNDYVFNYYKNLELGFFKPLTFSKYCPVIGVSYYNTEIFFPSIISAFAPKMRNRFDNCGNYSYPVKSKPLLNKKVNKIDLQIRNPYLDSITDLCNEKKANIILYLSPIYKTEVINSRRIEILNHSDLIKDDVMFFDNIHVNQIGRRKCSIELANSILK